MRLSTFLLVGLAGCAFFGLDEDYTLHEGQGGGAGGEDLAGSSTTVGSGGVAPSCDDGIQNGDESDVDCGSSCPSCANGLACVSQADCISHHCDGTSCAPLVSVVGAALFQEVTALARTPGGDFIVAGSYDGAPTLAGMALPPAKNRDIFVARLTLAGELLWLVRAGGEDDDDLADVAVASDGSVVVLASCRAASFGGSPVPAYGGDDICLAKLSPEGDHLWSTAFGSGGHDRPGGVAISGGEVWVAGGHTGINPKMKWKGPALVVFGAMDVFIGRLDAESGQPLGAISAGSFGEDWARAITAHGDGVVVVGSFEESMLLDGHWLGSAGGADIFAARLGAGPHWARRWGGSGNDAAQAVIEGPDDAIVIAGTVQGIAIDLGGGPVDGEGRDGFVARYDATGAHSWSRRLGGPGSETIRALAIDPVGGVVFAGMSDGPASLLGGSTVTNPAPGGMHALVGRLDATGGVTAFWGYGDAGDDRLTAVATEPSGNVWLTGSFEATVDFGSGPIVASDRDGFVISTGIVP